MQALDLIFRAGGVILALIVLAWLVRSRVIDRSKGRRRCPRCWYGMDGVPGLTCPECGRAAKNEQRLLRTRWRKRRLALGTLGLMVAVGVFLGPELRNLTWQQASRWMVTMSVFWSDDWPPNKQDASGLNALVADDPNADFERRALAIGAVWRLGRELSPEMQQRMAQVALNLGRDVKEAGQLDRVLRFAERSDADPTARAVAINALRHRFPLPEETIRRVAALLKDPSAASAAMEFLLAAPPGENRPTTEMFKRLSIDSAGLRSSDWTGSVFLYDGWSAAQITELPSQMPLPPYAYGQYVASLIYADRAREINPLQLASFLALPNDIASLDELKDALFAARADQLEPLIEPVLLFACAVNPTVAEWFVPIAAKNGADLALVAWFVDRLVSLGRVPLPIVDLAWSLRDRVPDVENRILGPYRAQEERAPRLRAWRWMLLSGQPDPIALNLLRKDLAFEVVTPAGTLPLIAHSDVRRQRFIRLAAESVLHAITREGSFPAAKIERFLYNPGMLFDTSASRVVNLARCLGREHAGPLVPMLLTELRKVTQYEQPDILKVLAEIAPDDPRVRNEFEWASENLGTRARLLARALLRRIDAATTPTTPATDRAGPAPSLRP